MEWWISSYGETIFKIILCMLLTGLIGYNREKNGTPIGIRTHILVGLSAVIIQITALDYSCRMNQADHMRLAGQFISGIAFLGTGTIMKEKGNIRGLTTASSIFFAACIGISVGTGMYIEAVLVTLIVYCLLIDIMGLKRISRFSGRRNLTLSIIFLGEYLPCQEIIVAYLETIQVETVALEITMISDEKSEVLLKVKADDQISDNELLIKMMQLPSILKVEILQG
ncbi:MAG: MgtC/SapB family protein [Cellulosilyticum sp.]|nr:MgtC/SapB family protein [Cellulosilyticum sp.]